jgi:integrase/recombinase XerD
VGVKKALFMAQKPQLANDIQRTYVKENDGHLWTQTEAWLLARKAENVSKGTLTFYRAKIEKFLAFFDVQVINQVTQITPDLIRRWLLALEEAGHNPGGIHAHYRTLKAFLNWWADEVEPEAWRNPISKVKAPTVPGEALEGVSRSTIAALLAACPHDWHGLRDAAIFRTLQDSGVRAAELLALDVDNVDLPTGALKVKSGKGRKPRTVFIGSKARRSVRAWLKMRGDRPGAVFLTQAGDRLSYDGLRAIVTRRAALAGIDPPRLHDFRRSFALAQLQAHVPETAIARMMGHSNTSLIARYARQDASDLQELYHSLGDE